MKFSGGQRGAALMIVLLVVTIATALSVGIAKNQYRAIVKGSHQLDRLQAYFYARGGEEIARQLLYQDFQDRPGQDDLSEEWAASDLRFEFELGEVEVLIEDMQGRFNLNDFVVEAGANSVLVQKLSLMTAQIGLDPSWLDDLKDFADVDAETRPAGAEDYFYLGLDKPYRTSAQPLQDLSEIRLLRSMTKEGYDRLSAVMAVLPATATPLNINTAEPLVLQSIAPDLTLDQAQSLVETRLQNEGYASVEEFLQQPELAGMAIKPDGLGVQSSFFRAKIRARYGEQIVFLTSLAFRDAATGEITVYQRKNNERFLIATAQQQGDGDEVTETDGPR